VTSVAIEANLLWMQKAWTREIESAVDSKNRIK